MCLNLFKPKPPEPFIPISHIKIGYEELTQIIYAKHPNLKLNSWKYEYTLCAYSDIAYIVAYSNVNLIPYTNDFRCADYAFALYGEFRLPPYTTLALGVMITEATETTAPHALNFFITEDKKLLYLEPQNDNITEELQQWQGKVAAEVFL